MLLHSVVAARIAADSHVGSDEKLADRSGPIDDLASGTHFDLDPA